MQAETLGIGIMGAWGGLRRCIYKTFSENPSTIEMIAENAEKDSKRGRK